MKLFLYAMLAMAPSCSFCGKTSSAPAPVVSVASVAPVAPVATWAPSAFEGVRPCVTSSVIERSTIAPYFDIEDEFNSDAIVAMGESAVVPLVDFTYAGRHQERSLATSVLGHFPCREAVVRLEAMLQDPDDGLRMGAAHAFVRSQGSNATPQLARMVSDRDASVQHSVVDLLARVGDARALEPLARLRDSNAPPWQRERAQAAILAIGQREADAAVPVRDR